MELFIREAEPPRQCVPRRSLGTRTCAIWASLVTVALTAALAAAEPPKVKVETVLSGLDNPTAVVFRPGTTELLISESGAGQVVRMLADKPGKPTPVITGFPVGPAPAPLGFQVGPLGIAFLDRVTLAVGSGGQGHGHDVVGIYTLPTGDKTLKFDDARRKLGPIPSGNDSKTGEGLFYAIAATPNAIFATSHGDDSAGWVSRAFLIDNTGKAADLKPLIKTKVLARVGGPMALVISKRGELVVGESGTFDKPHDSAISFYNPKDKGRLLLTVPTGLNDIVGLAYSPRSGNLYALDLAWPDAKEAGLYRIDATRQDGQMSAKAVKIASLEKPTALAFASDGTLYITLLGAAAEGAKEKPGQVVKITGDL
jgi:glucose/arabinose dehydrogenase